MDARQKYDKCVNSAASDQTGKHSSLKATCIFSPGCGGGNKLQVARWVSAAVNNILARNNGSSIRECDAVVAIAAAAAAAAIAYINALIRIMHLFILPAASAADPSIRNRAVIIEFRFSSEQQDIRIGPALSAHNRVSTEEQRSCRVIASRLKLCLAKEPEEKSFNRKNDGIIGIYCILLLNVSVVMRKIKILISVQNIIIYLQSTNEERQQAQTAVTAKQR